jgi:Rps23 Pro-64 3,4-dihydroxylase Tpa1-like proline 4-hydroxylase
MAAAIAARLERDEAALRAAFLAARPVRHFVVDDLLDEAATRELRAAFPPAERLMLRSSLRERKRVGVTITDYPPAIGDALYAFQDPRVVAVVGRITGYGAAVADPTLYASGISVMGRDDFLNPHIDNSHDGDGKRYRVLNLLYYVSPGWKLDNGGNLELWDEKVRTPTTVESRFNRLVVMETHQTSWHSVNRVRVADQRCCVSNYYFADAPRDGIAYRNVTTFTGRPEQPIRRVVLDVFDGIVLNAVGRTFPSLLRRHKHRFVPPPSDR